MIPRKSELGSVSLSEFGLPRTQPEISKAEYEHRLEMARSRATDADLDFLVVYGDREHFANLTFLTAHDPRFEEALLVIPNSGGKPTLILGNEGLGYSELVTIDVQRQLYQGFSLLGQKRDTNPRLEPVLRECGIKRGSRVGLVGSKYVTLQESDDPKHWLDVPAFIADALRSLTGGIEFVTNVTAIFMNPTDGLRVSNSIDQLAAFEFTASYCSQAVCNLIESLQPGMTELEAAQAMQLNGLPLSVHPMFSTGSRARLGLPSPDSRVIRHGVPFMAAVGLRGGLTARGGFVIEDQTQLPAHISNYLERLVQPYFSAVVAWYEQLGIGVSGDDLHSTVENALSPHDIGLAVNPGHYIHLDEWVHSPVYPGSTIRLRSGMLIQCDIIPIVEARYHTTNAEDTLALADEALRTQLAEAYPELWHRVQLRRSFMQDVLGIKLRPEVLPFSNMAGMLQPFALSPHLVMKNLA